MSYYTERNFESKKELKAALAAGETVKVWSRSAVYYGMGGHKIEESKAGPVEVALEGPHYPKPHTWYASAKILNGAIVAGTVR